MFFKRVYGIDLGSDKIKIYSQKKNEIWKERNMLAVRNKEQILAVGDEAYEMYEKTPGNVVVSSPMAEGMIANVGYLDIVLHALLEKNVRNTGRHPVIYFSVPADMTEIEKRAYYAVAKRGRFRKSKVFLVEKPIADALALGIPIIKTKGSMIVNIGAATTEISVIADSRIIISKVVSLGGSHFNQEIINSIRRKNNFLVSTKTAARLKLSLADLGEDKKIAIKVIGVDCVSGLPRERAVTSSTVNEALKKAVSGIGEEIRTVLDRTPPQIRRVILSEGIYLTGGSSGIRNIDRVLSGQTGCAILLSQYYDLCTVYGLKELITHDSLHHWAFTPKKQK